MEEHFKNNIYKISKLSEQHQESLKKQSDEFIAEIREEIDRLEKLKESSNKRFEHFLGRAKIIDYLVYVALGTYPIILILLLYKMDFIGG